MSNGHTPGPWKLELGRDGAPRGLRGPSEVEHRNIVNWNGFSSPTKPASAANARLIAAAPDLYQHAEALLADVMQRYGITADGLTCPHMRGLAEAIAKARGTPC